MKRMITIKVRDPGSRIRKIDNGRERDFGAVTFTVPEEETEDMVWNDFNERLEEAAVGEREFVWVRSPQEIIDDLDRKEANSNRKYYRHNSPDDETLLGFRYRQINTFLSSFGDRDLMMYMNSRIGEREREVFRRILVDGSCTKKEAAHRLGIKHWGIDYSIRKIRRMVREDWLEEE